MYNTKEERTLIATTGHRTWIGYILRGDFPLKTIIEGRTDDRRTGVDSGGCLPIT